MLLGLLPWTAFILAAMVEAVRRWWAARGTGVENAEQSKESLSLFCLIWLVIPILFFSVSQSKLPGYILPALPAGIILLSNTCGGGSATIKFPRPWLFCCTRWWQQRRLFPR